jgi:hypothetical protein
MMRAWVILIAVACAVTLLVVGGAAAQGSPRVHKCGSVRASGGGGGQMPRLTITVQGGSVSCRAAQQIIAHFQSLITRHARVSGYRRTQVNTTGDERCVKGATVIKGTYPG